LNLTFGAGKPVAAVSNDAKTCRIRVISNNEEVNLSREEENTV
jgi:hypothetical protein